ncbi:S1C family serine protease [Bacillus methanolicus]|uniref:Serine protease Do n=1 Tax=Bacillus methanolicus (strain MGA3 / ATCC 53907) TaxID=796606 RepID=I3E7B1_BACMM|nr:trypsin-like peptidase domain-containing protein [Bacillus methanolicus]AIE59212.1 serine protease Do [Bacillus methanolicus MGA3]EIJ82382.1 serine protease Do [Bacillus methanolicus MGA3]
MTDSNENVQNPIVESKKQRKSVGSKLKGFLSTVIAGIVGSVLTLAIAPHIDYLQDLFSSFEKKFADHSRLADGNNGSSGRSFAKTVSVHPTSTNQTNSIADIVAKASKAIVGIVNLQNRNDFFNQSTESVETGSGSGVIFKKDGNNAFIVTNNHVIEGAQGIEISLPNGKKTRAELIGADALTDLAVLRIDSKYAPSTLEFGDSNSIRPGDQVLAIGNPLGLDLSRTVTQGIVSAVNRKITVSTSAGEWDLNVIQTDAAINPGNSGGALINTQGQVIGINSLKISESGVEGLGFAIPSNDVVPIVNEIIEKGHVERPYIGVSLASLDEIPQYFLQNLPKSVDGGAMVTYVDPNSSAAKAGLQIQDVIVSINGTDVKNSNDLRKYLYTKMKIGDKITLKLYRQGKLKTVELTLTSKNMTY